MTLKELEQTISQLLPGELAEFREWFLRFDGDRWDEQIEKDASSGKLESEAAFMNGRLGYVRSFFESAIRIALSPLTMRVALLA